jgi:hypothetical protein
MRIDSSGNVGIGTTSPSSYGKLAIFSSTLGSTAGDSVVNTWFQTPDGNGTSLRLYNYRASAGASHDTSLQKIQRRVDVSDMTFIGFGSTYTNFGNGTTEHMRIDSSGNVGIGTSSPISGANVSLTANGCIAVSGSLSVDQTSRGIFDYFSNTTRFLSYGASGTVGSFSWLSNSGGLTPTEKMRIDSSGNVGIGTTSPSSYGRLVSKQSADTGIPSLGLVAQASATDTQIGIGYHSTSDTLRLTASYISTGAFKPLSFWTSDTERMRIHSSGGVSIGNTTDPSATNLSVTGTIASSSTVTGTQLISNVATGTAPLTVTSTTNVANLNASSLNGATFAAPSTIGSGTASTAIFTQLTVNGANLNTSISPTGTSTVAISPAGALTVNPTTASTINNCSIGATTPLAGTFTALSATSNLVTSVTAATSGLTANTTVTNTATYTTAGLTLATQTAAAGSVWRIRAYGQFTAASSATVRTAQIACFWGTTQLTAITPTVLASTAQTTQWQVEFELSATSTTAIWTTGSLMSRVASATLLAVDNATAASTTVTAGTQTLDLQVRVSSAIAAESWIIQQITMERIK